MEEAEAGVAPDADAEPREEPRAVLADATEMTAASWAASWAAASPAQHSGSKDVCVAKLAEDSVLFTQAPKDPPPLVPAHILPM